MPRDSRRPASSAAMGACRIFVVALKAWTGRESRGRITCGRRVQDPGRPGRCKIYPTEELDASKRI